MSYLRYDNQVHSSCSKCRINVADGLMKFIIAKEISSTTRFEGQYKVYRSKYRMEDSETLYYCKKCFSKYYFIRAIFSIFLITLSVVFFLLNLNIDATDSDSLGFLEVLSIFDGGIGYILTFMIFFIGVGRFSIKDSKESLCKRLLRKQHKLPLILGFSIHVFTEDEWKAKMPTFL